MSFYRLKNTVKKTIKKPASAFAVAGFFMPDALFQRQTGAVFIHNGRTDAFNLRQLIHRFKTTLLFAELHNGFGFGFANTIQLRQLSGAGRVILIFASVGSAAPASRLADNKM